MKRKKAEKDPADVRVCFQYCRILTDDVTLHDLQKAGVQNSIDRALLLSTSDQTLQVLTDTFN